MNYTLRKERLKKLFQEKNELLKEAECKYSDLNRSESNFRLEHEKYILTSLLENSFYIKDETFEALLNDFENLSLEYFLVFFDIEFDSIGDENKDLSFEEEHDKNVFNKNEEKTNKVLKEICTTTCTILDVLPAQEKR